MRVDEDEVPCTPLGRGNVELSYLSPLSPLGTKNDLTSDEALPK